jgi:glycine C-acetyltransferase
MGDNGRGTANHFGVTDKVDFIMGTFSKALASIGGFVATDDDDVAVYLKHHSRALIFSAALPASNVATVLTCLDIIENEPERVQRLWEITNRVRHRYEEIGLIVRDSLSPIVPIYVGSEEKAAYFSAELFKSGVFALPAVYPAVPKGQALIRTAYMSTHEDHHIDYVLDQLERLAKKFNVRYDDFDDQKPFLAFLSDTDSSARDACSAS